MNSTFIIVALVVIIVGLFLSNMKKDEKIESLEADYLKLHKSKQAAEFNADGHMKRIVKQETENKELLDHNLKHLDKLADAAIEITDLKRANKRLTEELKKKDEEAAANLAKIAELEQNLATERQLHEKEVDKLRDQVMEQSIKVLDLNLAHAEEMTKAYDLTNKLIASEDQIDKLQRELDAARESQKRVSFREVDLAMLRSNNNTKKTQLRRLRRKFERKCAEADQLRSQLAKMKNEKEQKKSNLNKAIEEASDFARETRDAVNALAEEKGCLVPPNPDIEPTTLHE